MKLITENLAKTSDALADTSNSVRLAVRQLDQTVTDANQRAQRQVARVDGMVTATLTAVVEVAETIATGIQGPGAEDCGDDHPGEANGRRAAGEVQVDGRAIALRG